MLAFSYGGFGMVEARKVMYQLDVDGKHESRYGTENSSNDSNSTNTESLSYESFESCSVLNSLSIISCHAKFAAPS